MTTQQNPDREIEELTIKQLEEQREAATNIGIDVDATIKAIKGKTQQNPTLEGWEERFENFFPESKESALQLPWVVAPPAKENLKTFIRTLITTAKEEGERKAYESVIEAVRNKYNEYDSYGKVIASMIVWQLEKELRAKFLNQGEET